MMLQCNGWKVWAACEAAYVERRRAKRGRPEHPSLNHGRDPGFSSEHATQTHDPAWNLKKCGFLQFRYFATWSIFTGSMLLTAQPGTAFKGFISKIVRHQWTEVFVGGLKRAKLHMFFSFCSVAFVKFFPCDVINFWKK